MKRLSEKLLTISQKVGLYVNDEKKEYTITSHQNDKCQQRPFINVEEHVHLREWYILST